VDEYSRARCGRNRPILCGWRLGAVISCRSARYIWDLRRRSTDVDRADLDRGGDDGGQPAGEGRFEYDSADETVHATMIGGANCYDAQVAVAGETLWLTWLEFETDKAIGSGWATRHQGLVPKLGGSAPQNPLPRGERAGEGGDIGRFDPPQPLPRREGVIGCAP